MLKNESIKECLYYKYFHSYLIRCFLHVIVVLVQNVVDKLLKKANVSLVVGTSSWREQFIEAITVSAGGSSRPSLSNCSCSKNDETLEPFVPFIQ